MTDPRPTPAASRPSGAIGAVIDTAGTPDLRHPFFQEVLEAVMRRVAEDDYDLVVFTGGIPRDSVRDNDFLDRCHRHRIGGVVMMGGVRSYPEIQKLVRSEIPCVAVDVDLVGTRTGYVTSASREGSADAVRHLREMGRTRIAHITGMTYTFTGRDRLKGYREALEELGLAEVPEYVQIGDYTEESGRFAAQRLLALEERPDAIFAAGDLMAIGAMDAIREAGLRVPEDIALVGFDDIPLATLVSPSMTTVRQDKAGLGRAAGDALLKLIDDPAAEPPKVVIPVELIVRESSGARFVKT
ncbi:MAG: LacI family DNA-binding transcriptional regulator [Gaiellaceae bacterium]